MANWPVLKSATSTCPRSTSTRDSLLPTVTRNWVPLTTAARYGVSTWKCWTFFFSTSSRIEPDCWMMVVSMPTRWPSFFGIGTPMLEFGETRMLSSPRISSTRPFWPVRTLSPGLSMAPAISGACSPPGDVTETSPDDLLTRQTSSAVAWDAE